MSLSYGLVRVIGGEHAGKLGYYDNEEGEDAVVYLQGAELLSGLRHRSFSATSNR